MWKKTVADLIESGMSQREIAEAVGCSQPYISDIASGKCGKRIGYELGQRLMKLHRERCTQSAA